MDESVTQLFVHCHGISPEDEERIADLMAEVELPVSSTEGSSGEKYVQMTSGFTNTDENEERVDKLFENLESEFEEMKVNRSIGEGSGYKHLPFDWIYEIIVRDEQSDTKSESTEEIRERFKNESVSSSIDSDWENTNRYEETESDSSPEWRAFDSGSRSQGECPECGGETERSKQSDETVCTECGFLLETSDSSTRELDVETTELGSDEERSDNGESPPETVDEWEMWYPCPTCGSTKLNQVIESHLYVSATEDGSYGGEQGGVDEYNYVECGDCREVLLDEIGKS